MPKVTLKKSDGVKFEALVTGTIFVYEDEAFVKTDYHRVRNIEDGIESSFDDDSLVSIATKVHVEY